MIQIPRRWEQWGKTLIAAVITGGANAGLAVLGITVGNAAGLKTMPLDWPQMKAVTLSGAFVGLLAYLAKSPVPPDSNGDTQMFTKPLGTVEPTIKQ